MKVVLEEKEEDYKFELTITEIFINSVVALLMFFAYHFLPITSPFRLFTFLIVGFSLGRFVVLSIYEPAIALLFVQTKKSDGPEAQAT